MKEITRVFTAQITQIIKVEDDGVAEGCGKRRNGSEKFTANLLKAALNVDDVIVKNVKIFIREVDE